MTMAAWSAARWDSISRAGGFVFGLEGDWDYSAINTGTTSSICTFSGNCQTGNNWLATARGRFGYAADRVLFYATAGGAFANVKTNFNGVDTTHTQSGWTAGGGVEWAFADNWTAKVEYLFVDLGNRNFNCATTACLIAWGTWRSGNSRHRRLDGKSCPRRRELQVQLVRGSLEKHAPNSRLSARAEMPGGFHLANLVRIRLMLNVAFGSKADVTLLNFDVRFTPESGRCRARSGCPLWANNCLTHRNKQHIQKDRQPRRSLRNPIRCFDQAAAIPAAFSASCASRADLMRD